MAVGLDSSWTSGVWVLSPSSDSLSNCVGERISSRCSDKGISSPESSSTFLSHCFDVCFLNKDLQQQQHGVSSRFIGVAPSCDIWGQDGQRLFLSVSSKILWDGFNSGHAITCILRSKASTTFVSQASSFASAIMKGTVANYCVVQTKSKVTRPICVLIWTITWNVLKVHKTD